MPTITAIKARQIIARQIINSRGTPAVEVDIKLSDNSLVRASSPSGASVGEFESVDLYDGGPEYFGKGVKTAVSNVNNIIGPALIGKSPMNQQEIDDLLIELDGTPNEAHFGTNAVLAVSIGVAKAAAAAQKVPVFKHIHNLYKHDEQPFYIPVPMFNVINGGAHADNSIAMQEFMVVPKGIRTYSEQLRAGTEIYHTLKQLLKDKNLATGVGDEGGFAPNLKSDVDAILLILEATEKAGYKPGEEIFIAIDVAISQFVTKENNQFSYSLPHQGVSGRHTIKSPGAIIQYYAALSKQFPILSIEDGLDENDWENWPDMKRALTDLNVLTVGDDFTVTNGVRLQKAIDTQAINSIIIKPNQIGTISEVIDVVRLCNSNNIVKNASHRSGETGDTFIAHLAVGIHAQFLKDGATARAERVEKYNELLRIEEYLKENS